MILAPNVVWYLLVPEFRDHHYILKPKSDFVEEETMTRDEKGTSYDGKELIKIIIKLLYHSYTFSKYFGAIGLIWRPRH